MVPRMVIKDTRLTHAEKTFYMCLKDMCGDTATCFRSMRTLAEETGISASSLSKMIPHLQQLGYIHGEKKARGYGGPPVWHISLVDIWEENTKYCAKSTQLAQVDESVVQNLGSVVQEMHKDTECCANFVECCANFTDRRRYSEEDILEDTKEEEGEPEEKNEAPLSYSREIGEVGTSLLEEKEATTHHEPNPSMKRESFLPSQNKTFHLPQTQNVPIPFPVTAQKEPRRPAKASLTTSIWQEVEAAYGQVFDEEDRKTPKNIRGMAILLKKNVDALMIHDTIAAMDDFEIRSFNLTLLAERMTTLEALRKRKEQQQGQQGKKERRQLSQADIDALPPPSPECLEPWGVYTHLGLYWWQDRYRTLEEADALGYNGGFGYYQQQQQAPPSWREEEEVCNVS